MLHRLFWRLTYRRKYVHIGNGVMVPMGITPRGARHRAL